jgi:hypothetical protein
MEDRGELVGVAFIQGIEVTLDDSLNTGTVMAHGLAPGLKF